MLPISLEITNFFSHKHSYVDFSQFESVLLIGNTEGDYSLSNGSGKSAIFESILWCLFNKARVAAMDDIILWGENTCNVVMKFKQDNVLYRVRRTRSRITGTSTVEFGYLSDDEDWVDISGSTARLTNSKIVSVIKFDYKTFINSAYFRQNDISEFAESDPGRKKEILKSIIDLSKWDAYEKEAKSRLKTTKTNSEILQAKIEELDIDEVELAKASGQLKTLNQELNSLNKERVENNEVLEKMTNHYQEIKSSLDTDQWDKIVAENSELRKKTSRYSKDEESLKDSIKKLKGKVDPLKEQILDLEEKISEIEIDSEIEEKIKKVQDSLIIYRTKLSTANNLLERLNKRDIKEGACDVCGQEISEDYYEQILHSHDEEIDSFKREVTFSTNKIEESNALLKRFEAIRKDNKKVDSYAGKIRTLKVELEISEDSLDKKTRDLENIQADIKALKSKHEANLQALDSLKNEDFQKLHAEIDRLRGVRRTLETKIADKNQEVGVLSEKTKTLAEKIESMKKDRSKLISITKKRAGYEKLSKLLGKNGIQTILLNAVIEDLEKTANGILSSICNEPIVILLETQRIGSDGVSIVDTLDLKVRKDGMTQNFKSLSGGEQFRISLSLRIALSEISSRHGGSSLEFLLLDEINSPLDRHGTENLFVNVIRSLEKKYKIMVITHNDSLKERFESVIDVTKVNGESSTVFTQK